MEMILLSTRRPDITFCADGKIILSARVSRLLSIHKGSSINIAEYQGEYLLVADNTMCKVGRHQATCYPAYPDGKHYRANSVKLCRIMLKVCNAQDQNKAALMCGEPQIIHGKTFIPIITKSLL